MTYNRSSAHYMWKTSCTLGIGTTGAVYQGMDKTTGECVAVKTFDDLLTDLQVRELGPLKELNHDNVVKLLAIEEEAETQKKVLITELCSGGSLYSVLEEPQNNFGLDETTFLNVLHDLSAGVKYLRDNGLIDCHLNSGNIMKYITVKPGNIMRFIRDDKKPVYKLLCCGVARDLKEEQSVSLNDTVEYLHPNLYEQTKLKQGSQKIFGGEVALWSIGVTLFHLATGFLPFRPFRGRIDIKTMHFMMTKRPTGVISGMQDIEDGPVGWSRELPRTCRLNQSLRHLVCKTIAGILECSDGQVWCFDDFFASVQDIMFRKTLNIFYVNEAKEVTLCMQPHDVLKDLQEQIATQLKVPQVNQMLLFDNAIFNSIVDPSAKISTFPPTSSTQPLILLHNENCIVKDLSQFGSLSDCFPKFDTSCINLDLDTNIAQSCCSVAHAVKRLVEKLARYRKLLFTTVKLVQHLLYENATKLCSNLDVLTKQMEELDQRFNRLERSSMVTVEYIKCWPHECHYDDVLCEMKSLVSEKKKLKDEISTDFQSLQTIVSNLRHTVLDSGFQPKEWDQGVSDQPALTECDETTKTYVNKIHGSWKILMQYKYVIDRSGKSLSQYGEQSCTYEKVKIQHLCERLLATVQQCQKSCQQAFSSSSVWCSNLQTHMKLCKRIDEMMVSVSAKAEKCTIAISEAETKIDEIQKCIMSQLKKYKAKKKILANEFSPSGHQNGSVRSTKSSSRRSKTELMKKMNYLKERNSRLNELISETNSLNSRLVQGNQQLESLIAQSRDIL